jgi:hypothetical protein
VVRQDAAAPNITIQAGFQARGQGFTAGGYGAGGQSGQIVDLPAYENDVLNALVLTGGLPGAAAADEIIIQRGNLRSQTAHPSLDALYPQPWNPEMALGAAEGMVRIPLRLDPGQPFPVSKEDVVLNPGDIVFVPARQGGLFFTGGLLIAGVFPLPTNRDLRVVEAVAVVGGPLLSGGIAGNNLSGQIVGVGIGNPSPSLLTVLRKTPGGGQVAIRVDLNEALRDPRENILVQSDDILLLQETPGEALGRYFTTVFNLTLFTELFRTSSSLGTATLSAP